MKPVSIVDCWSAFNDIIEICMYTNVADENKVKRIQNICWNVVLKLGREYERELKNGSNS